MFVLEPKWCEVCLASIYSMAEIQRRFKPERGTERCLELYIFLTSVCAAIPGRCIKLHTEPAAD
jgi:hypothetical protein